jgi:hypothetical protein
MKSLVADAVSVHPDLVLPADEYVENVLHNDFWSIISRSRRETKAYEAGQIDYAATVDVSANVPDMAINDWVSIGGDEPKEVYMVLVDKQEVDGRHIWSFEARFSNDLPARKSAPVKSAEDCTVASLFDMSGLNMMTTKRKAVA